jgi:cell division septation protein DedD
MRKTERRNDGTTEGRSPALLSVFPSFRLSVLLLLSVFPSLRLCAQSDPRLVTAVRLAQDGRSDSARAVAGRILAALEPTDSLYPEALYTLGLLAASEQDRRLYLRRVVVDYAQSAWADDALLQLVQLDSAAGDAAGAVREVDQLLRDYPGSPLTAVAALWGSRAAGDRKDSATACRMADAGLAAVGDDIELRNQLEFQKQRCQGLEALAAESTRAAVADSTARAKADSVARAAASRRRPSPPPSPAGRHGWFVQISAVKTESAAAAETLRAKTAGFDVVIARENGLLKLRAGAYPTRTQAQAAAVRIKAKIGGHPFVVHLP